MITISLLLLPAPSSRPEISRAFSLPDVLELREDILLSVVLALLLLLLLLLGTLGVLLLLLRARDPVVVVVHLRVDLLLDGLQLLIELARRAVQVLRHVDLEDHVMISLLVLVRRQLIDSLRVRNTNSDSECVRL